MINYPKLIKTTYLNGLRTLIFSGWKRCHKEKLGYKCYHRIYKDGSRECD